jgi:N-acetylmuramoyl-L-alanine amidase
MTTFLLGDGHGSNTPGKRSPFVPPGIREWEFNQDIVFRIIRICKSQGLKCLDLAPIDDAVPLKVKAERANRFYETDRDCVYIAVHANAAQRGEKMWIESAQGNAVFVHPNCSPDSWKLASLLVNEISTFGFFRNRGVKEESFYILRKTKMPAVLTKNGFMTHSAESAKLANSYWREEIAKGHVEGFKRYLKGLKNGKY